MLCPVHPFPLRGTSPQGETRDMERKTGRHILQVPFRRFPLWWLAPPPCTVGSMSYDTESKSVTLALYSSPVRAIPQPSARRAVKLKNPWARKGPSILRTFFRNPSTQPAAPAAPLFLICGEAATTTLGPQGPVKLTNPPARKGRSILRTFSL